MLRLIFDSPPLVVDKSLSERAQAWANYLSTRQVEHYFYKCSDYIKQEGITEYTLALTCPAIQKRLPFKSLVYKAGAGIGSILAWLAIAAICISILPYIRAEQRSMVITTVRSAAK